MKYHHYCKKCDIQFAFLVERSPVTKWEKNICKNYDSETGYFTPLSQAEINGGRWWCADASELDFVELNDNDDLDGFTYCNNCKRFIKNKRKGVQ
jgi:hypothetical protein